MLRTDLSHVSKRRVRNGRLLSLAFRGCPHTVHGCPPSVRADTPRARLFREGKGALLTLGARRSAPFDSLLLGRRAGHGNPVP